MVRIFLICLIIDSLNASRIRYTQSFHLFCSINIEAQERKKKRTWQNFTLNCQLGYSACHSVYSWILPTLANPAFVLKTGDLLTIKHQSFPISKLQVDKKLNRKKPPGECFILHKIKYKSVINKYAGNLHGKTDRHKQGEDSSSAILNSIQWSIGKHRGAIAFPQPQCGPVDSPHPVHTTLIRRMASVGHTWTEWTGWALQRTGELSYFMKVLANLQQRGCDWCPRPPWGLEDAVQELCPWLSPGWRRPTTDQKL